MVLQKRKTVSKVNIALKATRAKDAAIEESSAMEVLAMKTMKKPAAAPAATPEKAGTARLAGFARKMLKRPSAAAEKAAKKNVKESEEESEEEEEVATKVMKKPAGRAQKKIDAKLARDADEEDEDEEDDDEDGDEEDSEEDEEAEVSASNKVLKKPAGAQKKMDVDDEADEEEEDEDDEDEDDEADEEEEEDEEEEADTMKKPSAAAKKGSVEESEDEDEDEEESEEEDGEEEAMQLVAVEEKKEATEKEILAERTKELKTMGASDMKELCLSHGLATGTKDVMIKSLLKHEAKVRATAREQKAKIRTIVIQKKQELEALSTADLNKRCNDAGLKGLKGPERIQRLLVHWQENDGVDIALSKIAKDERKNELDAMDTTKLQKFCRKLGVDPYVKEIMVERISKQENISGCYAKPAVKTMNEPAKEEKKFDMVDELLANEAQRKKERALKDRQEEMLIKKRKELKALSVEDLKKRVAKRGLESTGKREDMIEALFIASVQEDAAAARKVELQGKTADELKQLLTLNGLETGPKDQMVKAMLSHEASIRDKLKVFEEQVDKLAAEKQKQLESKSNSQLKDMCLSKGVPAKGEKEERVQRLIEEERREGAFDKLVSVNNRNKRKEELMAKDKADVLKLCEKTGINPFVKDVMVERILSYESEASVIAADDEQPAAKKARAKK